MAVAGKIDEFQAGVTPVQSRQRAKGGKRVPSGIVRALVKAGHGAVELHQVERAVACQVEELLTPPVLLGEGGLLPNEFCRREPRNYRFRSILSFEGDRADVAFIEPRAALLGQDARYTLAVQIEPLVTRAVQPIGQVFEAFGIDLPDLVLDGCLAVLELQRRQRSPQVAAFWSALVTGLGNGRDERGDRVALLEVFRVI